MHRISLLVTGLLCLGLPCIDAAEIDPSNILVSLQLYNFNGGTVQNHAVREFTTTGSLVQTIPFPASNPLLGGFPWLRDIAVDQYGSINGFDGTENPTLVRYAPASGTFTHQGFPGWSMVSNTTWGGLATFKNFIYATDSWTYYGRPSGIIRFDTFNHTSLRFADGNDFSDLNIGADGKLYALHASSSGGTAVSIFDPITLLRVAQFALPSDLALGDSIRGLAADQSGRIFVVGQKGFVHRLSSTGVLEASQSTGFFNLMDIDVDQDGRILIGQEGGQILLGQVDLVQPLSSFLAYSNANVWVEAAWVSFAHPVPLADGPVPTPAPTPALTPTPEPTHHILVSIGHGSGSADAGYNGVREFTFSGQLQRVIPFDYNGGVYPDTEYLRDIVVDDSGAIAGFNGTFSPWLSRYSLAAPGLSHTTFPGWNIYNVTDYGGIGAYKNFVYVSDMNTFGQTNLNGIIRFNSIANAAERFVAGIDVIDLNVGLDGRLYALFSGYGADGIATDINAYHPVSMELLGHVSLPPDLISEDDIRSVAVDREGKIFVCGLGGTVYRLSRNGQLEGAGATGFSLLSDIDVDETGRLLVAQKDGWIITGDSTLAAFSCFRALDGYIGSHRSLFATFIPAVPIAEAEPTPAPTVTPTPTASATPSPTPQPSPSPVGTPGKLPTISISVSPKQIREGQDAVFTISLSAPSLIAVPFDWGNGGQASPGIDYTIDGADPAYLSRTRIIPPGETSVSIRLHATTDTALEKSESVAIQLGVRSEYKLNSKKKTATLKIINVR